MEQALAAEATREVMDLTDRMMEVLMDPVEVLDLVETLEPVEARDLVETPEPVEALDPEPEVEVMDMVRVDMVAETKEQDMVMDLTRAGLWELGHRQTQTQEAVQELPARQVLNLEQAKELVVPRFHRDLDQI